VTNDFVLSLSVIIFFISCSQVPSKMVIRQFIRHIEIG